MGTLRRVLPALAAAVALSSPALASGAAKAAAAPAKPAAAADTEAPKITHTPVTSAPADAPLAIVATITDESELFEPTLYYRAAGAKKYLSASMVSSGQNQYAATIPAEAMKGEVEYFIEVYDVHGNGPARFATDEAPIHVAHPAAAVATRPTEVAPGTGEPKVAPEAKTASVKVARESDIDVRTTRQSGGSSQQALRLAGWSTAGAGVAALGVGGIFGLRMRSQYNDAVSEKSAKAAADKEDSAHTSASVANFCFIGGGVLAAGGAVLLLLSNSSHDSTPAAEPASGDLTFSLAPSSAGMTVTF